MSVDARPSGVTQLGLGYDGSADFFRAPPREAGNMATTVTAICRYPVKGLSAEKMDRVVLMPGECLPHDRRFAIALGSTGVPVPTLILHRAGPTCRFGEYRPRLSDRFRLKCWPLIRRRLGPSGGRRFRVPRRTNPARACERRVPIWDRDWLVRSFRGPHPVSRCGDREGLRSNCAGRDHRNDHLRSGQP